MAKNNDVWGLEVGFNALKAVRLVRQGGQLSVADYAVMPFKKILTTPDLNVDEAIQVQLDAFLTKHEVGKSKLVVSVPGNMAFARFAKLPPVEPKKIPDIVRFEAVQQIPFPIEQVEWDYQVFQQEDSPDVEVGIFAITKERVMTFLSNYRRVNLSADSLTLSPLAVYNAFAYDHAQEDVPVGTIYMDIGTTSTDVIIVEGGGIWLRTLPIGGNQFTEALVKAFKLSFPKAEKLKREARTSKYARQIFQAMRPIFADLVQEVQRSLGYYQSLNRDADLTRLVGVGSTFRLPGLQKFLKQQLQLDVIRPDGFKRIAVEGRQEADFSDHAINLVTAYGCALQGMGLETVSANLLPAAILKQRLWKSKQPWIAAAAAAVAISSGLAIGRYYAEAASYASAGAEHDPVVKKVMAQANDFAQDFSVVQNEKDPGRQINNLRRLLDYRGLWPRMIEDVTLAAASTRPQPGSLTASYSKLDAATFERERQDWNRLYIDSIDAKYVPMPKAKDGQAPDLKARYRVEQFWTGDEAAPQWVMTVKGTTPNKNAASLLSRTFIQWLKDHADRPDHPYKIVVDEDEVIAELRRVGASGTVEASNSRSSPARVAPRPNPRAGSRMRDPRMPGALVTEASAVELKPLYPARPLKDIDRSKDWAFTLTWTVVLKKPEEARKAELLSSPNAPSKVVPAPSVPAPPPVPEASLEAGEQTAQVREIASEVQL